MASNAKIRQGDFAMADQLCFPGQAPVRIASRLGRGRLGVGRDFRDGLQDLGRDLVGVALRVWTTVFQIALVSVVGEGVRNTACTEGVFIIGVGGRD